MTNEEFAIFLKRLKWLKISNASFADYTGFTPTSICHFGSGKRPVPTVLQRLVEGLRTLDGIGIDLKNIIKRKPTTK